MGLSFDSISGVGPNGAIIHYRATKKTERPITTTEMYLLDSGGQYLLVFLALFITWSHISVYSHGILWHSSGMAQLMWQEPCIMAPLMIKRRYCPWRIQVHVIQSTTLGSSMKLICFLQEAYTRVLMGSIELAMAVWVNGTYGKTTDEWLLRCLKRAVVGGRGGGVGNQLRCWHGDADSYAILFVSSKYAFFSHRKRYWCPCQRTSVESRLAVSPWHWPWLGNVPECPWRYSLITSIWMSFVGSIRLQTVNLSFFHLKDLAELTWATGNMLMSHPSMVKCSSLMVNFICWIHF